MRVFITGGTGFIGVELVRALLERGHDCVVVSRSGRDPWLDRAARVIKADPVAPGPWQNEIAGCDAVVNLAGERIFDPLHRWTNERKEQLTASRVTVTRNVVDGMRGAGRRPDRLVSGSAIGFYGPRGDEAVDESGTAGKDFLAHLASHWEEAALEARDVATVALMRTGIVLGVDGGALSPLLGLFKTGLGGPWGDGRQWWSWIHIADQIGFILFALDRGLAGPFNLTAPNPVTVSEFARVLGKALRRPALLRAPEFALRAAFGEAAAVLFDLQKAMPERVLDAGYEFRFPDLTVALDDLLRGSDQ
jgi:uncharacterized protein (TIGR01777 family)